MSEGSALRKPPHCTPRSKAEKLFFRWSFKLRKSSIKCYVYAVFHPFLIVPRRTRLKPGGKSAEWIGRGTVGIEFLGTCLIVRTMDALLGSSVIRMFLSAFDLR